MNLINLLALNMKSWPENTLSVTQDSNGKLSRYNRIDPQPPISDGAEPGIWSANGFISYIYQDDRTFYLEIASDAKKAVVTEADYLAVKKLFAEGYLVNTSTKKESDNPTQMVDVVFRRDNFLRKEQEYLIPNGLPAHAYDWSIESFENSGDILYWRPHQVEADQAAQHQRDREWAVGDVLVCVKPSTNTVANLTVGHLYTVKEDTRCGRTTTPVPCVVDDDGDIMLGCLNKDAGYFKLAEAEQLLSAGDKVIQNRDRIFQIAVEIEGLEGQIVALREERVSLEGSLEKEGLKLLNKPQTRFVTRPGK